jgi:hypothetical protein
MKFSIFLSSGYFISLDKEHVVAHLLCKAELNLDLDFSHKSFSGARHWHWLLTKRGCCREEERALKRLSSLDFFAVECDIVVRSI